MNMTYQLDAVGKIRDQHLTGETVVLSEKDNDCHGLVGCTFSSGTLKLTRQSSKWPVGIVNTTVQDSDVIAAKPQKAYQLFRARFLNCRFHGVFSGVDFGHTDRSQLGENFGSIEGCDFTDATLDGCRFFNVDASTLRFPAWPHVVMLEPRKRLAEAAAMQWPGLLGKYMALEEHEAVKAVVMHVPSLARLVKCTEEEIKAAFEKFGGLQM